MSRIHPVSVLYEHVIDRLSAAGIESPRFEAQLLLGFALDVSRVEILRGGMPEPTHQQIRELERFVSARERRIPLAYLRGTQEFYGLEFITSPATLIPRPETELLVEVAIRRLKGPADPTFVDVGTGTGCIAVAVAKNVQGAVGLAIDISSEAIAVAQTNIVRHQVAERVLPVRTNLLDAVGSSSIDLVLSNPPYIPTNEIEGLQPEVRNFEPRLALDGGADGFDIHRKLISGARRVLKRGGGVAIEVAAGQARDLAGVISASGFADVRIHKDLAGIERVVEAELA